MSIDKRIVIESIIKKLDKDLIVAVAAAENARETATSKENIAENKYDTLGLEAAYLAHGQSNRAQRLSEEKAAFSVISLDTVSEVVGLGALVSVLGENDQLKWFFVGPGAAGLTLTLEEGEVVVITPESPLGIGLWGLSLDDTATVNGNHLEIVDLL